MTAVFKLDKIRKLLGRENIEVAFVVDTNVLMDCPIIESWETPFDGRVLFILPELIGIKLQDIQERNRGKEQSTASAEKVEKGEKAREASRSLGRLFSKGCLAEGISIEGTAWFISVHAPIEADLEGELSQIKMTAKALGPSDATLLVLIKQLNETLPDLPSYLLSADVKLGFITSARELPVKLSGGFPIEMSSHEIARIRKKREVNWDSLLEAIEKEMSEHVLEVELVLRARRTMPGDYLKLDPEWPDSQIILVEGSGSVNGLAFEWSLPFSPWDYPFCRGGEGEELGPSPSFWMERASLAFGSDQLGLDQRIMEQIASRIAECAYPFAGDTGLPCLQDTISIMKYFFYRQYLTSRLDESLDEDFGATYSKSRSFAYFCVADILYPIACGEGAGEEMEWDILVHLFRILSGELGGRRKEKNRSQHHGRTELMPSDRRVITFHEHHC